MLTPDMVITVTTRQHTTDPFYNGAVEIQEQYMRCSNSITSAPTEQLSAIFLE